MTSDPVPPIRSAGSIAARVFAQSFMNDAGKTSPDGPSSTYQWIKRGPYNRRSDRVRVTLCHALDSESVSTLCSRKLPAGQHSAVAFGIVISYDTTAEPVIAINPEMSAIEAQEWVRREHTPVVILGYEGGRAVQSVLVFEDSAGAPALEPFWYVTDLDAAVQRARQYLTERI